MCCVDSRSTFRCLSLGGTRYLCRGNNDTFVEVTTIRSATLARIFTRGRFIDHFLSHDEKEILVTIVDS